MNSIFSNYLTPLGVDTEGMKPSDVYNQLRIAYNQGVEGILLNTRMFCLESDKDDELLYEIWRNKDLSNIVVWINKKITLTLGLSDYRTIGVRLRIATGMLNKLVAEGKLSKDFCIRMHDNFVKTINSEISAINTEDLPF